MNDSQIEFVEQLIEFNKCYEISAIGTKSNGDRYSFTISFGSVATRINSRYQQAIQQLKEFTNAEIALFTRNYNSIHVYVGDCPNVYFLHNEDK